MTEIGLSFKIPAGLERAARAAGLLSGKFVRRAIERELERRGASHRLVQGVEKIRHAGFAPLTSEEVQAEIHAVRAARKAARADRR